MRMKDNDDNGFLSMLYHTLRARRRRQTIRCVHDADSSELTVRTLARQVAATEHELPHTRVSGEPYRNAYNALSQTHLPTLAEAGIVIYDPQRQTVSTGPNLSLAALLIATNRPAIDMLQEEKPSDGDDPS